MNFEFPEARIQIFCKAPVKGEVMTRLIPALGEVQATALHEKLARRIIDLCRKASLAPVELWCTPDATHEFFSSFASGTIELHEQVGCDLGERMLNGARSALARSKSVVIVGTDTPGLDEAYLHTALSRLEDHEAVLGPAADGGYVLIGLTQANPAFFGDIAWGTDKVCSETCRRFNQAGLNWSLLPPLDDIDRPEDLDAMGSEKRRSH